MLEIVSLFQLLTELLVQNMFIFLSCNVMLHRAI